jgi:flagellar assembly factor FliW
MTAVLPAPAPAPAAAPASVEAAAPAVRQVTLTEPLPGFPRHRDYVLVAAEPTGLLCWLQSMAPDGPRFLVVPPAPYVPTYAPRLPGAVLAELGVADPDDALLYCLVTVPDGDVRSATANLRAPLVIDPLTGRARQVVLVDGGHPIRHPLRR